jgi:flagellar hook-basal body complex protein FliE
MMQWEVNAGEPISSLAAQSLISAGTFLESPSRSASTGSVSGLFSLDIGGVSDAMAAAEAGMSDIAAGKPVGIHEVMINLERAQMSVQTFIQIRNKLVEAYQDLMRMQM